jgi:hypothetical protein
MVPTWRRSYKRRTRVPCRTLVTTTQVGAIVLGSVRVRDHRLRAPDGRCSNGQRSKSYERRALVQGAFFIRNRMVGTRGMPFSDSRSLRHESRRVRRPSTTPRVPLSKWPKAFRNHETDLLAGGRFSFGNRSVNVRQWNTPSGTSEVTVRLPAESSSTVIWSQSNTSEYSMKSTPGVMSGRLPCALR